MSSNVLREKSASFGDRVIACCRVLQNRQAPQSALDQLFRAGTSAGANIAEAQFAHGKKDFVAKLEIALKEINETGYWLDRLFKGGFLTEREYKSIRSDAIAIKKMLLASITTVKNKSDPGKIQR